MNAKAVKILLVEDNAGDLRLIRELLSEPPGFGTACTCVETLAEARGVLEEQTVDIVLLDLSLPDSHGYSTFERLHAAASGIPVIVLTGLDDEELAVKTVHGGAQDYLVKGQIDSSLLTRAVRYAIERKKAGRKLAEYAEELRSRNEQMLADLNMAREIQHAFLPRQYRVFPQGGLEDGNVLRFCHRYEPTTTLAGDFFEIIPVSGSEAGVFICDVMGHGVRAALVTAFLRGLIEELTPVAADPGAFLTEINRGLVAILKRTDSFVFASAFYLVVELERSRVRYANAGHPEPFHVRRTTAAVEPLRRNEREVEPALGLLESFDYRMSEKPLDLNDLIFLYTDGLYEVMDSHGEQFGEERLLAGLQKRIDLPPESLLDALLSEVRTFSAADEFADDVCLVCVETARAAEARLREAKRTSGAGVL